MSDEQTLFERHEILTAFMGFILLAVILISVGSVIVFFVSRFGCQRDAFFLELPWKYDWWSGCFYKVGERWVSEELLNMVDLLRK